MTDILIIQSTEYLCLLPVNVEDAVRLEEGTPGLGTERCEAPGPADPAHPGAGLHSPLGGSQLGGVFAQLRALRLSQGDVGDTPGGGETTPGGIRGSLVLLADRLHWPHLGHELGQFLGLTALQGVSPQGI